MAQSTVEITLSKSQMDHIEKVFTDRNQELGQICEATISTLGIIDDWLGSASTRQAAMDSMWRLQKMLKQAGFEYAWRNALDWRGAMVKEMNDAGFFVGEDGLFHFDPMAEKEKPYRIYGNAKGPTVKEFAEERNYQTCEYRKSDDYNEWLGACGFNINFDDDDENPTDNGISYCPGCGRRLTTARS